MSSPTATTLFWGAAALCLVAQLALVWSAIRAPMPGTPEAPVRMPRRGTEVAWTVVPALALAIVLVFTWRAARASSHTESMPGMNMPAGHATIQE